MPIGTRVVPDAPVAAPVALLDMAAERSGSTLRDRGDDTRLGSRHGAASLNTIRVTVLTEYVRHREPTASHRRDRQRADVVAGAATGRGKRSSGLVAEQTFVVASRRYRAVVSKR